MRLVTCENISSDMILARNIYKHGSVYLCKGERNLKKYSMRLKSLGVDYVYVVDDTCEDIEIPDMVSEQTRNHCQDALTNTFKHLETHASDDFSSLSKPLNGLVDEIVKNGEVQINLTDISMFDEYTLGHSVSVAIYSVMMGLKLGYSRDMLDDLAKGAVLHDIGKLRVDPQVLFKESRLTDEEFEHIKLHSTYGYQTLKFCRSLSVPARLISYCHHEHIDGSGYPRGLKGDEIPEFAKIAAIADVYDALSTNRCYRKKMPSDKIMDLLMRNSGTHFDTDLLAMFLKSLAIYPNGSEVHLSDGYYGLIYAQTDVSYRPVIKVTKDPEKRSITPYIVDLSDVSNFSIVITESQLELNYENELTSKS